VKIASQLGRLQQIVRSATLDTRSCIAARPLHALHRLRQLHFVADEDGIRGSARHRDEVSSMLGRWDIP
jgi:hypothetical protein